MRIAIGSDEKTHLTHSVIDDVGRRDHEVELFGPLKDEAALWPEVARQVAEAVASGRANQGILFCWTGTGVSIAANKVPGIRAALCHDAETARGARRWNDANILVFSLRATAPVVAKEILDAWFSTEPSAEADDVEALRQLSEMEP